MNMHRNAGLTPFEDTFPGTPAIRFAPGPGPQGGGETLFRRSSP